MSRFLPSGFSVCSPSKGTGTFRVDRPRSALKFLWKSKNLVLIFGSNRCSLEALDFSRLCYRSRKQNSDIIQAKPCSGVRAFLNRRKLEDKIRLYFTLKSFVSQTS